jgi:hypothetical protein
MSLTRRLLHAVKPAGALGIAAVLALPALALPRSTEGFVVAKAYAAPSNIPGSVSCAGTSFCLQLTTSTYGASPSVLRTVDGGSSWRQVTSIPYPATAGYPLRIECVAVDRCFAGTGRELAETTNGGVTWTLHSGLPRAWSLGGNAICLSDGACVAVGAFGHKNRTVWLAPGARAFEVTAALLPGGFGPDAITCPTSTRCLLTGVVRRDVGITYLATSVGASMQWKPEVQRTGWVVSSIACPTTSRCAGIVEHERVMKFRRFHFVRVTGIFVGHSTDGGATWQFVARPRNPGYPALVTCASATVCSTSAGTPFGGGPIFIGVLQSLSARTGITTLVTTDGGARWSARTVAEVSEGYSGIESTSCFASGTCVADAAEPYTGGRTVSIAPSGATTVLPTITTAVGGSDVTCTTSSTCYRIDLFQSTAGFRSALLVSSDNGATWKSVATPAGEEPVLIGGCQSADSCEVVAVHGVTLQSGLLGDYDYAGSHVDLLVTSDGGTTWTQYTAAGANDVPTTASCSSSTQCSVLVEQESSTTRLPYKLVSTQNDSAWTSTPVPSQEYYYFFYEQYQSQSSLSCGGTGSCLYSNDQYGDSYLFRSTDGGASWIVTNPPGPAGATTGQVACFSTGSCALLYTPQQGGATKMVETSDGGVTWSAAVTVGGTSIKVQVAGFSCDSSTQCTAVLSRGRTTSAVTTNDGGSSWSAVHWPATQRALFGSFSVQRLSCSSTTCLALTESESFTRGQGTRVADVILRMR